MSLSRKWAWPAASRERGSKISLSRPPPKPVLLPVPGGVSNGWDHVSGRVVSTLVGGVGGSFQPHPSSH